MPWLVLPLYSRSERNDVPLFLNKVREMFQGNYLKSFNCASLSLKSVRSGKRN